MGYAASYCSRQYPHPTIDSLPPCPYYSKALGLEKKWFWASGAELTITAPPAYRMVGHRYDQVYVDGLV